MKVNHSKAKLGQQGFTLVEVMVALSIFVVLLGVTVGVFFAATNSYQRTSDMASDKLIGDSVYRYISRRLVYADDISVNAGSYPKDGHQIKVQNGRIFATNKDGTFEDVFSKDSAGNELNFYRNSQIQLKIRKVSKADLEIAVEVLSADGILSYQTVTVVRCLSVAANGSEIACPQTTIMTNPVISYLVKTSQ